MSFLWVLPYYAQLGELERFDCTYSKEIIIPFNYSETHIDVKPQLNQVVFYSYRDQFTYWYKITAKSNNKLSLNITAINDSDSYVVYCYQYNNADFCTKLYNQKLKPITTPYYIGFGSEKPDVVNQTLAIQKDNIYYVSVLNTSLNNCGHHLILSYGSDTLKVKAFHTPCKKDITSISITQKAVKPIVKVKDTVATLKPKIVPVIKDTVKTKEHIVEHKIINEPTKQIKDTVKTSVQMIESKIDYVVKDQKKINRINSTITVVDLDTKESKSLINKGIGKWEMFFDKHKTYKIKCAAFGYKDLQLTVDLANQDSLELLLEPLKVGDNFIMKSIYFHPNTYALRNESNEELQRLLSYLTEDPSVTIEIQGHTNGDNKIYKNKAYEKLGEEWNFHGSSKNLSLKRSETIKNYLVHNGVAPERLFFVGQGGDKPIIKNPETMEEGQRNIRVEVVILKN
jgi:outer membrane protein OmpA-like peptidoglycan-associated protein